MPPKKKTLLFVDGYNVLNAWKGADLKRMADARDALIERLRDYAGATGQTVIVVFDAWMSERRSRTVEQGESLTVVYTQRGETADHYIERSLGEYAREVELDRMEVRIATSDLVEQTVALGRGAMRVSARELIAEMEQNIESVRQMHRDQALKKSTIMDALPADILEKLERMRRGG